VARQSVKVYLDPAIYAVLEARAEAFGEKISSVCSRVVTRYVTDDGDLADHVDMVGQWRQGWGSQPAQTGPLGAKSSKSSKTPMGGPKPAPSGDIHSSIHPFIHSSIGADPAAQLSTSSKNREDSAPQGGAEGLNPPEGSIQPPRPEKSATRPSRPHGAMPAAVTGAFDTWWELVPRKAGKGAARRAWSAALKKVGWDGAARSETLAVAAARLNEAAQHWAKRSSTTDMQFICYPSTWLNGERWLDEHPPEAEQLHDKARERQRAMRAEKEHDHVESLIRDRGRLPHLVDRLNVYRRQLGRDPWITGAGSLDV